MIDEERFGGIARLYGVKGAEQLSKARVAVVGIGGVGSWAAEALARSGVGTIILQDMDDLCITNTNRQIHALQGNYGRAKVEAMEERKTARANALYNALEQCNHFRPLAASKDRTIMNVTFTLDTPEMTAEFLAMAQRRGMISLKGYRTVGGCRASLYNGMPDEGVAALIDCICAFEIGKRT